MDRLRAGLEGRYTIERELGRGGMATVYLAVDVKHQRQVALKLLHPEFAAVVGPERFLREIDIAATLSNPHILPLYDSGQVDGLLYYVMPYVAGESLENRIRRETQLPIDTALAITKDIAAGLTYAHDLGLVHRDIKPGNILLDGDSALLADFGIARAVDVVAGEEVTDSGMVIGTPEYMSPEQGQGHGKIDARSDIYSLGCVLYEMLAGEPPFDGPTAQVIIARHQHEAPRSLTVTRSTVPTSVQFAIESALAKVPADRPETAERFVEMLDEPAPPTRERTAQVRYRRRTVLTVMLAAAAVIVLGWLQRVNQEPATTILADTSRYMILPFEYEVGVEARFNEEHLMHDALTRWSGLSVVDQFQVGHALARTDSPADQKSPQRYADLARNLGAGRYIRGNVAKVGSEVRIYAVLYDVAGPSTQLMDHAVRFAIPAANLDSLFEALGDRLLFRDGVLDGEPGLATTTSLPARQAFSRGFRELDTWNLVSADTAFAQAAHLDPDYAQAHLWVALVRSWNDNDQATWRLAAEQAVLKSERLSDRDRAMSQAILAQASDNLGEACPRWTRLAETQPNDFAAWYGTAWCLRKDNTVLTDPTSESGWSFRTSYRSALDAYAKAFRLHPAVLATFGDSAFAPMRRLVHTSPKELRFGETTDGGGFAAYADWRNDSLAFVPYSFTDHETGTAPSPDNGREAIRQQQRLFHEIALAWVTKSPQSPAALEALAVSLEMLVDPGALDTLRAARQLAGGEEATRLAVSEAWLRIKTAVPHDLDELRQVRFLIDTLLSNNRVDTVQRPDLLASLATLTGRAHLAGTLSRQAGRRGLTSAPAPVTGIGTAFLVYASLGGPSDSLDAIAQEAAAVSWRDDTQRRAWLCRPVSLAFPDWIPAGFSDVETTEDMLVNLQLAWLRGDGEQARTGLARFQEWRRPFRPSDLTIDGLYPEARLLMELGDTAQALGWIAPYLDNLSATEPATFTEVAQAGTLIRAMALRAELEAHSGDTTAAVRWAKAVHVLLAEADSFLQPLREEMSLLRRSGQPTGTDSDIP